MPPRKEKINYGEQTGKCDVCDIALWSSSDNKPVIRPCNIQGCPYENPENQNKDSGIELFSYIGSGLGQIDF